MRGGASIFDKINDVDIILAFFPCTRFEAQFNLWMIGKNFSQSSWDDKKKLEYALRMHTELSENYKLITMLSIICLNKRIPLIIENPYSKPHYLNQWWPIAPTWIDHDRTKRGDAATKPTQYWFFNMKPKHNFVLEPQEEIKSTWKVEKAHGTQRSMISKDYARKFIKEFIL